MILVTGGTGMLGSFVVRELLGRGMDVRVLSRTGSAEIAEEMGAEIALGNLTDADSLRRAALDVDGIVHVACTFTDPTVDEAAMEALLEAWDRGPFVFISSVSVYGLSLWVPTTEDHPLNDNSSYGLGKIRCERLLAEAARSQGRQDYSSLRPPNIWGPHLRCLTQKASPTYPLIERVRAGQPIVLPGATREEWSQYGDDWIDARELAWAAAECLAHPLGGPANAINGHFVWHDFWVEVIRLFGSTSAIEHVRARSGTDFFAQRWRYSGDLLRQRLGFQPRYRWRNTWASIAALVSGGDPQEGPHEQLPSCSQLGESDAERPSSRRG